MAWVQWILLATAALGAALLLALHLLRFRYSFDYAFPAATGGRFEVSFLFWRKAFPFGEVTDSSEPPKVAAPSASPGADATGPRPGQEGFVTLPFKEKFARLRLRFKSAGKKWILDLPVWGHLITYLLGSGLRALRFAGPTLQHLHVGSADIVNLGRFAAVWSSLRAGIPFLACPVEYGFNERPFALRLKVGGGCTALGLLGFALALALTLPWLRLFRRFAHCWRNPRLHRWQRKLVSALA